MPCGFRSGTGEDLDPDDRNYEIVGRLESDASAPLLDFASNRAKFNSFRS